MIGAPQTLVGRFAATVARLGRKNASTGFESTLKSILPVDPRPFARIISRHASDDGIASAFDQPFEEAIAFLKQKTATPTESYRDVWDAAHSKMFMVAGANSKALVEDFQASIQKALETGSTLEDFRKDFDAIVKKHGWSYNGDRGWRTDVIFDTNMRTAYAAGRYAQMTEPDTLATFPNWQYNHSGSLHPRVQHLAWNGQIWPANDPIWGKIYPPNGYHCGCFVVPLSAAGMRRAGKTRPDRVPDLDQLGTDQPLGIDPSFAYNPGKAWLDQTAPGPKAVSADAVNIAAFVRSSLKGKWPDGAWTPVAIASKSIAADLDVPVNTEVRLSADTIRSHVKHAIATADAYGVLPKWLAEHGRLVKDAQGRWSFVGEYYDGKLYQAGVKVVKRPDGKDQIYLVSLRRTNDNAVRRLLGKV
ncbi:phage head morphogenesis protein [Rhizobium mayense]|uniref:Phage minor head protein n=1 Tax=Rhizobium mayense TaxID=1312184 RepID=A0ABT7JYA3_9HYPH|nr:phage minor head protein [Rhizobium mayense]MDL2401261.1 phage minor head protein [Rhizobium mayense]